MDTTQNLVSNIRTTLAGYQAVAAGTVALAELLGVPCTPQFMDEFCGYFSHVDPLEVGPGMAKAFERWVHDVVEDEVQTWLNDPAVIQELRRANAA